MDQHGVVLDILVQKKRDGDAAKRFFRRLLQGLKYKPKRLITEACGAMAWPGVRCYLVSNTGPVDT